MYSSSAAVNSSSAGRIAARGRRRFRRGRFAAGSSLRALATGDHADGNEQRRGDKGQNLIASAGFALPLRRAGGSALLGRLDLRRGLFQLTGGHRRPVNGQIVLHGRDPHPWVVCSVVMAATSCSSLSTRRSMRRRIFAFLAHFFVTSFFLVARPVTS
ncbi:MAG: hypothetical protein ACLTQP_01025 [Faecalibacterium prausnitzii]